jgi:hypothetical protein
LRRFLDRLLPRAGLARTGSLFIDAITGTTGNMLYVY